MEEILLYFSLKYEGDFRMIFNALQRKEPIDEELKEDLFGQVKCNYTTLFSEDYPDSLKEINDPPFVIYYYGDLSLVKKKCIGVVGMRSMSHYGVEATKYFVEKLVYNDYAIVSGMAKGIDTVSHQTAIDVQGQTIAVLGTGIDYCYPYANKTLYKKLKENYLVMSEYPARTNPTRRSFPLRNRIVAGLSQAILVIEAKEKSGTMITVGYALEQGKDIYCVPSRYCDFQGCNELIKQGAKLINSIEDVVEEIHKESYS